eukprot:359446-Chlamydomonas_euryale.AAC.13
MLCGEASPAPPTRRPAVMLCGEEYPAPPTRRPAVMLCGEEYPAPPTLQASWLPSFQGYCASAARRRLSAACAQSTATQRRSPLCR